MMEQQNEKFSGCLTLVRPTPTKRGKAGGKCGFPLHLVLGPPAPPLRNMPYISNLYSVQEKDFVCSDRFSGLAPAR